MRTRFFFIGVAILFSFVLLTGSSYAKLDLKTCLGMWLLEEGSGKKAIDSSGNKNDGDIMGNPKWIDGKFGKALQFNGSTDYVSLPELPEQSNKPLSVIAWINWEGSTATTRGVWGYTNVATVNSHFEIQSAGMRLRLGNINKTGMTSPPKNQWSLVCFTYDGNNAKYYLNGAEIDGFSGGSGGILGTRTALGHMFGVSDAGRFFDGAIDEIAIFNVAIGLQDIQSVMNQGLRQSAGLAPVDSFGKLATTWATIKAK